MLGQLLWSKRKSNPDSPPALNLGPHAAGFFSLVEAMIDCYKDFKNNNLKFSKVRYCFEMICFVVFFVGMGYIGVSKFVVDFIK